LQSVSLGGPGCSLNADYKWGRWWEGYVTRRVSTLPSNVTQEEKDDSPKHRCNADEVPFTGTEETKFKEAEDYGTQAPEIENHNLSKYECCREEDWDINCEGIWRLLIKSKGVSLPIAFCSHTVQKQSVLSEMIE